MVGLSPMCDKALRKIQWQVGKNLQCKKFAKTLQKHSYSNKTDRALKDICVDSKKRAH